MSTQRTILILAANPASQVRLRLDKEVRDIDEGLRRARHREEFRLAQRWAVQIPDIRRALLDESPHIVHFCGHGRREGIFVDDGRGGERRVDPDALATLFSLFNDSLECVVLNACYSAPQAEAIAKHIPHVIGMQRAVSDNAALEFSVAFYDSLGAGTSYRKAYDIGCVSIKMRNLPEGETPVFLGR